MTWVDEHGVAHLVRQLPEELWQKLDEAFRNAYRGLAVIPDDQLASREVVFINCPPVKSEPAYPRFQTYCGEKRDIAAADTESPTCIECVKTEALVARLAHGFWWHA